MLGRDLPTTAPNCPHKRSGSVNSPWKDPNFTVKGVKRGNGKDRKECVKQINIENYFFL